MASGRDESGPAAWPRRMALGLGLALLVAEAAAATAPELRVVNRRTRLVLHLPPGLPWKLTALTDPARLVLDLPGLAWQGPNRLRGAGVVASAQRQGAGPRQQLVLNLAGPVAPPRISQAGRRVILELQPGPAAGFARLADGRVLAAAAPPPAGKPLVVLDPGHGGKDPGAIGARGTHEKRITLAAALELKRQLEAGGRCRVALTRARDVFIPLGERIEQARRREAALFLSLHADSAPGARGASVYTLSETASDRLAAALAQRENQADRAGGLRLPSVSPEVQRILLSLMRQETRSGADRIARLVVDSLDGQVPLLPNTHRRAGFVVLKAPDVPSALVEMGFLSHPADEAALNRPAHRVKIAKALAEAVHGFLDGRAGLVAGLG
ncbi:N-acetylmuramoyl-L-alanine amidase [Siccirubricoccus sp. KC 17139]|uniref:N-acetylmuramoyl-L-alanine amidase n=1 Tax=Siccirubricoccus soli TaxID=2899147 RepID=A0ABT1D9Z3_9PROT|nr:N-acetylmuramoyl-L-alanine amidase [Siccirubricoccus soli]MCO6418753.1 N-acetylmuramoyl-L-alanine amidase [Siccirubricoccus soli]MCP2684888.1 N-acetylmuramoyl-L-alanine amidase [Siccirubricoccus soli]